MNLQNKILHVEHTEKGVDFITFYFTKLQVANEYAKRLYSYLSSTKWKHIHLQRKNFMHLKGDPEHFHSDGHAADYWKAFRHFHIIYPHKPTKKDWDELYKLANSMAYKIRFKKDLETREVKA